MSTPRRDELASDKVMQVVRAYTEQSKGLAVAPPPLRNSARHKRLVPERVRPMNRNCTPP